MTSQRWGILGGIFDPIHYGHLAIAEQTRGALELDKVLFVPAGRPVHKDAPDAEGIARMRMVEMAIADNPAFEASWIEVNAERPSYTLDTLTVLGADQPDVEFVLIVSSETAALMPTWHQPEQIVDLAQVAIVSRLGHADISKEWIAHHFPRREDRFIRVETTHLGHSSTAIRARVAAGKSIRYLVPESVESYIEDNQLYASTK
ncbi:MAG: nicotinate-nucleotide adenylyltransferase [Chloroflexota bacterium]